MYKIAVDIGGTFTRVALFKEDKITKFIKSPTPRTKKAFLDNLLDVIESVKGNIRVKGIGIGVPGPADYKNGIINNPPNLPIKNVNLKKIIQKRFKTKIIFENDANCVALAEKYFGVKKKNIVVLTLGTGIGGGIIINNELHAGDGNAGEVGHMIIKYVSQKKIRNTINHSGSFEVLSSGKTMMKRTKRVLGKSLTAKQLTDLARQGNRKAEKILEETTLYLALGISNLIYIINPEIIVLAGGVKEAGDYFLNKIKTKVSKFNTIKTEIVWTKLDEPGLLGASTLIK